MGYEAALTRGWEGLIALNPAGNLTLQFLADEYSVDLAGRKIISLSCNSPAKDFTAIILLHYLAQKIKGLPQLTGAWLDFKELSAIEGYQQAFRQRVIERIIRKYGSHPEGLYSVLERLSGEKSEEADVSIVLNVLEGVPALIELWKADDEFGAEANILFDKSITGVFCTEDIVVLSESIARYL
ncbi:MAG TPA: DUF3786 domain-containing protein [Candidatus Margulisiibacteriota bacterium]|nr:DUF3786 domain-containing protein [Candidatus Margulisiibacteriota bacterium]